MFTDIKITLLAYKMGVYREPPHIYIFSYQLCQTIVTLQGLANHNSYKLQETYTHTFVFLLFDSVSKYLKCTLRCCAYIFSNNTKYKTMYIRD